MLIGRLALMEGAAVAVAGSGNGDEVVIRGYSVDPEQEHVRTAVEGRIERRRIQAAGYR